MTSRSLLLACLWLAALPAAGESAEFALPLAGATLAAGEEVAVQWSGAPAAVVEMELMLSVDGGRRFAVRLTRELEPKTTSYLWRVPRLPTRAARLALRVNLDGREVEVGTSAPFVIEAGREPDAPAGSIRFLRGELWWLGSEVAGSEGAHLSLAGLEAPPPRPQVLPSAGEKMLANLRFPEFSPRPEAVATPVVPRLFPATRRPASLHPLSRTPRLAPLRI